MSCSLGVLLSVRIWERVVVPGVEFEPRLSGGPGVKTSGTRKEGESRWLGVWRGWTEGHTAVSSGKHMGWRRRGEWGDGERSGERRRIPESKSVVVRHKALPSVQVRCPVRWRLRSTRAREVQSVWHRQTMGSRGLRVPRRGLRTD